ncbi:unnamed protein product [Effrenium voratum]|uniref:Uncharacterized protein n=1 Tax=Effrenium voratum TaxID=2562239 RepID=A0AA36MGW9_9DINO|nr:unnamed protein product [Effrenium voratum]
MKTTSSSPIGLAQPVRDVKKASSVLSWHAAALLLRLGNVSLSTIHILTQINHKAIEKMSRNLDLVRKWHVQREVDEATFDKKTLQPFELSDADAKTNKSAQYEYWHRNEDLWRCTGQVLHDYMRPVVCKSH